MNKDEHKSVLLTLDELHLIVLALEYHKEKVGDTDEFIKAELIEDLKMVINGTL